MTYRNIDTSVWKDDWFLNLQPDEKLLFIYLFSNENTTLTGLYKISLRVIEFETGLDQDFILSALDRFSIADKAHWEHGIVFVVNLRKYNDSKSPKVAARIKWELDRIPECDLKTYYLRRYNTLPVAENTVSSDNNTVSIDYPYTMDTDPTLTIQVNTNQINTSQEQGASDYFSFLQHTIEKLTGLPVNPTKAEVGAINEMISLEVTEDDLLAAVNWFKEKGRTARGPASILESVKVSHAKRIQAANPNGAKQTAGKQAVWAEDYDLS